MGKYMWIWCLSNTLILLLMFMYLGITKDVTAKANDRCNDLEKKVELLDEKCDYIYHSNRQKIDTLVININNIYNNKKKSTTPP